MCETLGDTLCCTTWSEHFRAINDAYTSSVVFMLHPAEQTANQWVQIRFTFISEFPSGLYDSVIPQTRLRRCPRREQRRHRNQTAFRHAK